MEPGTEQSLSRSLAELNECAAVLRQITDTCCMPERSGPMSEAAETLREALVALERGGADREALPAGLDSISRCGGRIGELYVTCCTETREPLYRRILEGLNRAHGAVEKVLSRSP